MDFRRKGHAFVSARCGCHLLPLLTVGTEVSRGALPSQSDSCLFPQDNLSRHSPLHPELWQTVAIGKMTLKFSLEEQYFLPVGVLRRLSTATVN